MEFVTETTWCQGASARAESGEPVFGYSPNAVMWDLPQLIKRYTEDEEERERITKDIKSIFKINWSQKWEAAEDYYKRDGKIKYVNPLWRLNDLLDSYAQLKQLCG